MIFKPAKVREPEIEPKLYLNQVLLNRVGMKYPTKSVKFLGVEIDDKLQFTEQAKRIGSKARSGLFALNQAKHYLNTENRLTLYNSLIGSHLQYAAAAWATLLPKAKLNELEKLQKKAMRIVAGVKYNEHTAPLFKKFKVLKLVDIARVQAMTLIAAHKKGESPGGLESIFQMERSNEQYALRQVGEFAPPAGDNKLAKWLAEIWNQTKFQETRTLGAIKYVFKDNIIQSY